MLQIVLFYIGAAVFHNVLLLNFAGIKFSNFVFSAALT